jgi:uncharacterized membrane protein
MNVRSNLTIAAAAAMMALSGVAVSVSSASAGAKAELVHCYGVNACKGQSDCKSGNHACKGQNDCKGQGFKAMTAEKCTTAGGSLTAPQ